MPGQLKMPKLRQAVSLFQPPFPRVQTGVIYSNQMNIMEVRVLRLLGYYFEKGSMTAQQNCLASPDTYLHTYIHTYTLQALTFYVIQNLFEHFSSV